MMFCRDCAFIDLPENARPRGSGEDIRYCDKKCHDIGGDDEACEDFGALGTIEAAVHRALQERIHLTRTVRVLDIPEDKKQAKYIRQNFPNPVLTMLGIVR